jgi:hypothetical protein
MRNKSDQPLDGVKEKKENEYFLLQAQHKGSFKKQPPASARTARETVTKNLLANPPYVATSMA